MKKYVFITFLLVAILKIHAQDYVISFAGAGASEIFDSVKVENLTQNKSILVPGGNQLRLNVVATGINSLTDDTKSPLSIYPNPAKEYSLVEFDLLKDGSTTFEVFDLTGKKVAQMQSNLESGKHSYSISGLCSGVYTVSVKTDDYHYTGKIISQSNTKGDVQISYNDKSEEIESTRVNKLKSTDSETTMQYSTGDRLKLTGISGVYRTIFTDIPTESKTITFTFVSCTDGDNNNYPIVTIGTQTWMAENLKTTKYTDGNAIPNVIDATEWSSLITPAYCWYNNEAATYKAKYGALYNWYAVSVTTNGNKNVCPTGWHVPLDDEWTTMENYLIANGYNYDGTTTDNKFAKALASASGWSSNSDVGTVGNTDYPAKRNATGFTALPGGYRYDLDTFINIGSYGSWWSSSEVISTYAWSRYIFCGSEIVWRISFFGKSSGFSVRCVRDL